MTQRTTSEPTIGLRYSSILLFCCAVVFLFAEDLLPVLFPEPDFAVVFRPDEVLLLLDEAAAELVLRPLLLFFAVVFEREPEDFPLLFVGIYLSLLSRLPSLLPIVQITIAPTIAIRPMAKQ